MFVIIEGLYFILEMIVNYQQENSHKKNCEHMVKSISNNKILDNEIHVIVNKNLKFSLGRMANIVRKKENAGYQHFLLFPQCFLKASFLGLLKVRIAW